MNLEANEAVFAHTFEGTGSCPDCHIALPPLVKCAPEYFESGHLACAHCGKQVELWQETLKRATRLGGVVNWALQTLGAVQTNVVLEMETGKYYRVQLTDHGVSENARILSRRYAPQGDKQSMVTALEWHPNDPAHRIRGTLLPLLAVPVFEGPIPRTGSVLISVTWIRSGESDAWPYLVTSFEAVAANDYAPGMVFAQSAVEISMMPVVEKRLRRRASADNVKHLMNDALTFGHTLNVMLPYLCAEVGMPPMPEAIRGALNKLRKKRNAIIHRGTQDSAVSPEEAIEGLCAAAFGFEYIRHVEPALMSEK